MTRAEPAASMSQQGSRLDRRIARLAADYCRAPQPDTACKLAVEAAPLIFGAAHDLGGGLASISPAAEEAAARLVDEADYLASSEAAATEVLRLAYLTAARRAMTTSAAWEGEAEHSRRQNYSIDTASPEAFAGMEVVRRMATSLDTSHAPVVREALDALPPRLRVPLVLALVSPLEVETIQALVSARETPARVEGSDGSEEPASAEPAASLVDLLSQAVMAVFEHIGKVEEELGQGSDLPDTTGSHPGVGNLVRLVLDASAGRRPDKESVSHLRSCKTCKLVGEGIAGLGKLLRELPRPDPPEAVTARLTKAARQAGEVRLARAGRLRALRRVGGSAVAAVVAILLLVAGRALLGAGGRRPLESPTPAPPVTAVASPATDASAPPAGPAPAFVDRGRSFPDLEAARAAIEGDATIRAFKDSYRAEDVGGNQRSMQIRLGEAAAAVRGRSPAECMNAVLRAVPRPILPAYVEHARFAGKDAWLLVFVYARDVGPKEPLSGVVFYAMAVEDCTFLGTAFWD